jgi:hypothetical protein
MVVLALTGVGAAAGVCVCTLVQRIYFRSHCTAYSVASGKKQAGTVTQTDS